MAFESEVAPCKQATLGRLLMKNVQVQNLLHSGKKTANSWTTQLFSNCVAYRRIISRTFRIMPKLGKCDCVRLCTHPKEGYFQIGFIFY